MALYELQRSDRYEVRALLTTVTAEYERISMHGVRTSLLELQAQSVGVPLQKVYIPRDASNAVYERSLIAVLREQRRQGVRHVAFGDLFLEDIRRYREQTLAGVAMEGLFPLWRRDTKLLAQECIHVGFRAVVCCIDQRLLGRSFAGRQYDENFLADLPATVDPCGENGEFHSFVYAGPNFSFELPITVGESVERGDFLFTDLTLAQPGTAAGASAAE